MSRAKGARSLPAPMRRALAALTPPALYEPARRAWHREWAPAWEVVDRWTPPATAWDQESVARVEREAWPRHVRMSSPTGVLGAEDGARRVGRSELWRHNTAVSHAYALMLAERERRDGHLSILDWGGGVGQFHLTAKAVLPDVEIRYEVKDLPALCRAGRSLQPEVTFHDGEDCLGRRYDLVMAASSLQYHEDWQTTLARLGAAAGPYLFLSRVPTVFERASFLVRQRPYRTYDDTEYVSWVVNRDELLAAASRSGLTLTREFLSGEEASVRGAPEQFETRGFLFRADGAP
jgi:putative methyltransferase (TIGR04325 family)